MLVDVSAENQARCGVDEMGRCALDPDRFQEIEQPLDVHAVARRVEIPPADALPILRGVMHGREVVDLVGPELGDEPGDGLAVQNVHAAADAYDFGPLPAQAVGHDATVLPVASDDEGAPHPETISSSGSGR